MRYFSKAMLVASAALCLNLSAYSQDISLKINNVTVKEAMERVKKDTGYSFVFSSKDVNTSQRVSVSVSDATIEEVIKQILKGQQGLDYEIQGKKIVLRKTLGVKSKSSKPSQVRGKVIDANGETIIGASIKEKGTTNGTITDLDGNFSLKLISNNPVIEITYVGYETQSLRIQDNKLAVITLEEDAMALEEVVVVGYGSVKKAHLTSSVANLKGEEVLSTKSPSLAQALQGKVAGLQIRQTQGTPGSFDNYISIRGFGTPLYVIDGVVRSAANMQQLNPEDIESVSIIKDGSAAIYGVGAQNGVILVTTKKGKEGKLKINYSGNFGIQQPTHIIETMNSEQLLTIMNEAAINGNTKNKGELIPKYDQTSMDEILSRPQVNYWDEVFNKVALSNQHSISLSGGNNIISAFTSIQLRHEGGLLKSGAFDYNQFNVRSNVDVKINNYLSASLQLYGQYGDQQQPRNSYYGIASRAMAAYPWEPIYTESGEYATVDGSNDNPVLLADISKTGFDNNKSRLFQSSLELLLHVPRVKGLDVKVKGSYDGDDNFSRSFNKGPWQYKKDGSKDYQLGGAPWINEGIGVSHAANFQGTINYANKFQKHDISAMLGFEQRWNYWRGNSNRRFYDGFFTIPSLGMAGINKQETAPYEGEEARMGLIGRLNYSYDNRYMIEGLFRYDGSYRYAPGHRWGFFPSISAGWRVSEEAFLKNLIPSITNLKLRASYGVTGADAGSPYQFISAYTKQYGYVFGSDNVYSDAYGMSLKVVNPALSWTHSHTMNLGVDFSWKNDLLFAEYDYFVRNEKGAVSTRQGVLPNTFGGEMPEENLNEYRVLGMDLMIGHRNKIGDFSYCVKGNASISRSMVVKEERVEFWSSWDRYKNGREGRYTDFTWAYEMDGRYMNWDEIRNVDYYESSSPGNETILPGDIRHVDTNGDGIIDDKDKRPVFGTGNPLLYYGLSLDLEYKSFYMNMLFQGSALNRTKFDEVGGVVLFWGKANSPATYFDRWHQADMMDPDSEWIPGYWPSTRIGGNMPFTDWDDDFRLRKANYLRMKSLELGYILPKKWVTSIGLSNVKVYFNAYNLFTICEEFLKNFDPEKPAGAYNGGFSYPLMRTYSFGLNISL